MKIPEIKTRNKIRDAKICNLFLKNELELEQIGVKFGISGRQVSRILYKNASVLKLDADWEKIERIQWLKKQIKLKGDSKKDTADLQIMLKEELEGAKPIIDNSKHITNITINKVDLEERVKLLKENAMR